jgi:rubredoxin
MSFSSNVAPRKFGKGGNNEPQDWECICGYINPGRVVKRVGGDIVCWMCGLDKDYLEKLRRKIVEYRDG